jgi:hypothetical protein
MPSAGARPPNGLPARPAAIGGRKTLPLGLRTLRAFLGALRPRSKPTDPHHLAPTPGRKRGDAWRKQPCPCGGRRPGAKGEKPLWPHHFAVTYSNSFERMIELSSQD